MSQFVIKRSRVLSSQSVETPPKISSDRNPPSFFDYLPKDTIVNPNIECVFKTSGFLKLVLLSISPTQNRNVSLFRGSDQYSAQVKTLFYVHFVFKPDYFMIQSMMEGQSMYTCISLSKEHLKRYTFAKEPSNNSETVDVAVPLQGILICVGMFSQNHEISLSYNFEDKHIVLRGNCSNFDKYKYVSDTGQFLICKLKTISATPLNIPFEDLFFNIHKYDYFTICPKLLYSCFSDVTTDATSTRMIIEVTPPTHNSTHILGMSRENSAIIVQWDFSFDKNIFEDYRITKNHLYKYSTKCIQCVTNGLKISDSSKVMIKENGALLIKTTVSWNMSEQISLYYYICPFIDSDTK
ncbi:hypothetical protein MACJ_003257 [Theileria orientalis]|uniref:Uncharacterized protein n=1 Tax=Theileria orientalis TaxID=68886 RepID=A0A976M7E2_THEOR|nr:hypothetical protein MACJ_003257 [Theileria orientalis]